MSIIEAVRKWAHYLHGQTFTLITDQKLVAFMFNPEGKGKIKNAKIQQWRLELSVFKYRDQHRPGINNTAPDSFSRVCGSSIVRNSPLYLLKIHETLGNPGVRRLDHFFRCKNLPFSVEEVKRVCSECRSCAEIKPQFFRKCDEKLIKAIQSWQRISIDFKGPAKGRNNYSLIVIDEYSRFPFVFHCRNMTKKVVIECLTRLFCLFSLPGFVHSDRGDVQGVKEYLTSRGVATSRTTPYHSTGNVQCERWNQTIWRTMLHSQKSPEEA